ncbi:MAG: heavy metal translocating P-type ATPase [Bacteroidales bacterium]
MNLIKHKPLPLLKCKTIHELPGRIRVFCRALEFLPEFQSSIEERLNEFSFIEKATVNPISKRILIFYSKDKIKKEHLIDQIENTIANYSIIAFQRERSKNNRLTVNERRLQEEPIANILRNVALSTFSLIYSFAKRANYSKLGNNTKIYTSFPSISSLILSFSIFKSGIKSLIQDKRPNADTLSAASIVASIISKNPISALTIILLADIAELLTSYSMNRTRKAISGMISTGEEFVWKETANKKLVKTNIEEIKQGDIIAVHTGEKISVDGTVIQGDALVDQSSISGEYMPASIQKNHKVFAGSIVQNGTIKIITEKTKDETAVSRIIHMVEEASQNKARVQNMADKFSAQLIPLNFVLSAIVFLITKSPIRALNMLIIDYSCGLRLSTATALSAAISTGARNGILFKGSNFLESIAEADSLIFDKTGTLTLGTPKLESIIPTSKYSKDSILQYTAAAEETSKHPIASAILDKLKYQDINIPSHSDIKIHTARGVETKVENSIIRVGSERFMKENQISIAEYRNSIHSLSMKGQNIAFVAKDNYLIGILGVLDPLRDNMKKAINRLRFIGIDDIVLLTGDQEYQAEVVANRMTLDRFESELLPEDKARFTLNLQSKGSKVVMVGDGINDAPALAYADVGIALGGKRTDIAMEAADITITSDDPLMVPQTFLLAKKTMQIVRQNFATAIGVNSIGLILGAIGILPVFWGAFMHNMTTIAVVGNSLRLIFHDMDKKR